MIKLGEGWIAEGYRIYHKCGPGFRVELPNGRESCDCGAAVPRRVRHFADWLSTDGHEVLIAALLGDTELDFERIDPDDPSDPE